MKCTDDSQKYMKCIVEDQLYIFLIGLDHNVNRVSSHVLANSSLPTLEEAYSLIRHKVQRLY